MEPDTQAEELEQARLREILSSNDQFVEILQTVRDLGLPEGSVGAGVVRDVVWNSLSGSGGPVRFRDVDVVYFDTMDLSPVPERRAEVRLEKHLPDYEWDVKNQAAVHRWYGDRFGIAVDPLLSLEDAVASWPETATAVAVRLEPDETLTVIAPLGVGDLLRMVWRYNPTRATIPAFRQRLADKRLTPRPVAGSPHSATMTTACID